MIWHFLKQRQKSLIHVLPKIKSVLVFNFLKLAGVNLKKKPKLQAAVEIPYGKSWHELFISVRPMIPLDLIILTLLQ